MINRVSPEDGRMLGTSNDYKKLDSWALAYRKARGEEQTYCPARAEKREAMQRHADGEDVPFVRGEPSTPRSMMAELQAAKQASAETLLRTRDQQRLLNGALGAKTRAMHEQHRAQWTALSKDYADRKRQVYETAKETIARSGASITEQYRPTWRDLLRKQWREYRAFDAREKTVAGKIGNALHALTNRAVIDPDNTRGLLSSALNFVVSKAARSDVLDKLHAREKAILKTQERKVLDAVIAKIKADRTAILAKARTSFAAERQALILRQEADRQAMQLAWRDRKADMARAFDTLAREAAAREAAIQELSAEAAVSASPFRKAFNEAGRGPTNDRPKRTRRR